MKATAVRSAAIQRTAGPVTAHPVRPEQRWLHALGNRGLGTLLQRKPALAPPPPEATADCKGVELTRWIKHIDVFQEQPQHVDWEWSDGKKESARCSTGKGHCCVGAEATEGAACTEAGSRIDGSNCTAVGSHAVQQRLRVSPGGVEFWTEFITGRGMALHKYAPVDGTPLSHGCVRMDEDPAIKIWCGSRDRASSKTPTAVAVHGLARPRCDHPALQKEWLGDFSDAGRRPKDGETFDAKVLHHIAETRSELRRALGMDEKELDRRVEDLRSKTHDFSTSAADLAALALAIPHCVPTETVEEHRLGAAAPKPTGGTPRGFVATPPFDNLPASFARDYRATKSLAAARNVVAAHAQMLWATASARAHGKTADLDDRPLYWTRLAMEQALRSTAPGWLDALDPDTHRRTLESLIDLFEQGSRGMTAATFTDPATVKRIVISGFDPFGLDTDHRSSNPSGAAVLALDGQPLASGKTKGHIEGVIFPVRYLDFDAGTVERFFGSYLSGKHPADLILTISMGISADTELEEAAGRRRSTRFPENLGLAGGGSPTAPVEPSHLASGAEFLTTTVPSGPLGAMRGALGRTGALKTETEVSGLPPHKSTASTGTAAAATSGAWIAVTGSGGGFLSNEIFYRTLLLVRAQKHVVPMIHLHTPHLAVTGKAAGDTAFTTARDKIVKAVRDVLVAALPTL